MNKNQILTQVGEFLESADLDLQHAVLLLGGSAALMRLQRLRASVATANAYTIWHRRGLEWLHDLLALEHVGDLDRDESGHFAEISPEDPAVLVICGLTDQLEALIARIDEPTHTSLVADLVAESEAVA